jgi:hypothetical protein
MVGVTVYGAAFIRHITKSLSQISFDIYIRYSYERQDLTRQVHEELTLQSYLKTSKTEAELNLVSYTS